MLQDSLHLVGGGPLCHHDVAGVGVADVGGEGCLAGS